MHPNRHQHWVCFLCRKQVRKLLPTQDVPRHKRRSVADAFDCSICHAPMVNMGNYFRPPRRNDRRAWEQMRLLAHQGIRFYTEVSAYIWGSEGVKQRSLRATKTRLYSARAQTEGERLLYHIDRKSPYSGRR